MFGAAGLRDIGYYFPDTDQKYKNIRSSILLENTLSLIQKEGFLVINIDSTICLEKPRIAPHVEKMKETISGILRIDRGDISIKATTTEKMGFTGREEGVVAIAVVLLSKTSF